ncbi:MAG: FHA domain-containing protein, partial [Nitrospirales bacterium]
MTDDRTIQLSELFPIVVRVEKGVTKEREHRFTSTVRIGRSTDCHLQLLDRSVSKSHVEIRFEGRQWWIHDLQSRNGTFLNGARIDREPLGDENQLELGRGGPILSVTVEALMDLHKSLQANASEASPIVSDLPGDESSSEIACDPEVHQPTDNPENQLALAEKGAKVEDAVESRRVPPIPRSSLSDPAQKNESDSLEQLVHEVEAASPIMRQSREASSEPVSDFRHEQNSDSLPPAPSSMTQIIKSSLNRQPGEEFGERTIMIKRTFEDAFKRRSRKYRMAMVLGVCLLLILAGVAWYQTTKI